MFDKLTGKPVHAFIQFICCLAIAIGMPWSKVPISFATLLLFLNLILKWDFKTYWNNWKSNKAFLFFVFFLVMEWVSLLWTENFGYFISDFVVKLPLYVICISLIALPITNKRFLLIVGLGFLGMLTLTSFINVGSYFHWWGNKEYDDIRSLSLFTSHIRYALLIAMGIVLCFTWIIRIQRFQLIPVILILWFCYYTNLSQVLSGYISVGIVLATYLIWFLYHLKSKPLKTILLISFLAAGVFVFSWMFSIIRPIKPKIQPKDFPTTTAQGNPYSGVLNYIEWENGYPVNRLICEQELEPAWNAVSAIDYKTGLDEKNQGIRFTLWRYLSSLGLPKDSAGVAKLSKKDIHNIEKGIASILLIKNGLKTRLYTISKQIEYPGNPNGHSLLQRIESWKAAKELIAKNPILGVGTGDVNDAFMSYYLRSKSELLPENQHRAHNQFLTIWISSGLLGFIFFTFWWLVQVKLSIQNRTIEWLCYTLIIMSSFLIEDTIETQLGAVICSFFFTLFSNSWQTIKQK